MTFFLNNETLDALSMIPFNRASFDGKELTYLAQAVINGHVSGNGPFTQKAEQLLRSIHGSGRTLLTTSCTHALEMAACLLRFEPGDEVIVPAFTFVSTASAFMLHGAKLVFVDVDEATLNINPSLVEDAISDQTRAICIVHYAGIGADPELFRDIADRHNLVLIEDNAHGLFGTWKGRPLGTFGQMSTLSFHETKNLTCGEGGALHLNDESFVERAEILREKGTNRSRFLRDQVDKYTWVDLGSSWVLSDLLAGVLVGQLERSRDILRRRCDIWSQYHTGLAEWADCKGIRTPVVPSEAQHPAHMYFLRMNSLDERTRFIDRLRQHNVSAVFHYQPLHLSDVGRKLGGREGDCPVTEDAADTLVRLPLHTAMSDEDISQVINAATAFD